MGCIMKRIWISLLLLLASLAPLTARGRAEEPGAAGEIAVFLLLGAEERPDSQFVERFDLPLSAAAYAWTEFRVQGGGVELREAGGLRILSKRLLLDEPAGGRRVIGYALKASGYDAAPGPPRETLTVRYDYPRRPGEGLVVQPARRALLEGIAAAGTSSGFVRLEELSYLGSGRFRARVAVR